MFLRIKKIKNREYCYIVENAWSARKGVRQRVKGYLGAVVRLTGNDVDFFDFHRARDRGAFLNKKKAVDILRDVVVWELVRGGFVDKGKALEREGITVDKGALVPRRDGRNVVLAMNEGYFCPATVQRILDFEKSGDIEQDSVALARAFVDAGLAVPQEAFIAFFEKVEK